MASKKFSEFALAAAFDGDWYVVGYDPGEPVLENANKRVLYSAMQAEFASQADLNSHTSNSDIHVTAAQSAALDASSAPSGVNPFLTQSAGNAAYDASGSAAAVQTNLDSHTGAAAPHTGHALAVHAHTGDQVTISAGVQGNAVAIAADGSLEDSGTPPGGGGGGGHVIQDEGTPLTQRANLNFTGSGVSASDDSGNDASRIVVPGPDAAPLLFSVVGDNSTIPLSSGLTVMTGWDVPIVNTTGAAWDGSSLTFPNDGKNRRLRGITSVYITGDFVTVDSVIITIFSALFINDVQNQRIGSWNAQPPPATVPNKLFTFQFTAPFMIEVAPNVPINIQNYHDHNGAAVVNERTFPGATFWQINEIEEL